MKCVPLLLVVLVALFSSAAFAAGTPRTLTAEELQRMRDSIAGNRASVEQAARAAQANQQAVSQQIQAMNEADAYEDGGGYGVDDMPAPAPMGFAEILAHGMNAFQDELAKGAAQKAAMDANLARIRVEAEAVDRERQRQLRAQEAAQRQAQLVQQQRQMQAAGSASTGTSGQATAAQARDAQMRADVAAERQRLASRQQADKAEADRQAQRASQQAASNEAEQKRLAVATAAARKQQEEAARHKVLRQAEQALRSGFSGHATTCPGGGKDVLYLQTTRPTKTGCNVSFEARCPATPAGAGTAFAQANYIGGSCMGIGDNIRIGTMACAANAVQITMTRADCGSGG